MLRNRLAQLREERAEGGFTLIELLVVVVIIGILIAIAIPLYLNYQKGANDKSAMSDLRGAISTLEQCNSNNGSYPTALTAITGSTTSVTACTGQTVNFSKGTTLTYLIPSGATSPTAYEIFSTNSSGSGVYYCYSSASGGQVRSATSVSTTPSTYSSTCPS